MDQVTILGGKVFACEKCGACCKHLDIAKLLPAEFDRGDGQCIHLLPTNRCAIYNNRPDICRGEYLYHTYFNGIEIDAYYKMLHELCLSIRAM